VGEQMHGTGGMCVNEPKSLAAKCVNEQGLKPVGGAGLYRSR